MTMEGELFLCATIFSFVAFARQSVSFFEKSGFWVIFGGEK
jgi:hypothetical protein